MLTWMADGKGTVTAGGKSLEWLAFGPVAGRCADPRAAA